MKAIVSSVNYSHSSIYPKWRSGRRYRRIRRSTKTGRAVPGLALFYRTKGCAHANPKTPPLSRGLAPHAPLRTAVFSVRRFGLSREHFDTLTDEIHLYLLLAGPGWAPDASPPVTEGIRH
jgi:hypothetical protein